MSGGSEEDRGDVNGVHREDAKGAKHAMDGTSGSWGPRATSVWRFAWRGL